jgi:hypothetical protein
MDTINATNTIITTTASLAVAYITLGSKENNKRTLVMLKTKHVGLSKRFYRKLWLTVLFICEEDILT